MSDRFFRYELDRRWSAMFAGLRVGADDGVTVTDDGMLRATYGWATLASGVSTFAQP